MPLLLVLLAIAGSAPFLGGCSKSPTKPRANVADVVIPSTTKVLAESTLTRLQAPLAGDSLVFDRSASQVRALSPGDVVISAEGAGLLRRVTRIEETASSLVVHSEPAALTDAIESASISVRRTLSPQLGPRGVELAPGVRLVPTRVATEFAVEFDDTPIYDGDGNPGTTSDQIRLAGSVRFEPTVEFSVSIRNFQLQSLVNKLHTRETAELSLTTGVSLADASLRRSFSLPPLAHIVIMVGPVPVVLTPVIDVVVGLDGEVSLNIEVDATATGEQTVGLSYSNPTWTPIWEHAESYTFTPPHVVLDCEAKAWAGPRMTLLLYGTGGPWAQVAVFARLKATPGEPTEPWWKLEAGVEGSAGVMMRVFGRLFADYTLPTTLTAYQTLAQAAGPPTGQIGGLVRDAVTGLPLSGVAISATLGTSRYDTATNSSGRYVFDLPAAPGYELIFSKSGYVSARYQNVGVTANFSQELIAVLQVDNAHATNGTLGGRVVDAASGAALPGALVSIRNGINSTTGPALRTTTTNSTGSYSFANLAAGSYTLEGSASGYTSSHVSGTCIGNVSSVSPDVVLTPILPSGQWRIILTWGQYPGDLDSHLTGPAPDGTRFHLYYPLANSNAGSDWPDHQQLDLDDVTSYGPETTTLHQQLPGVYRFSVHDFTNGGATYSTALPGSSAQVRIYTSDGLIRSFNVPAAGNGTLWTVFEIQNGTIVPINSLGYEQDSGEVPGPANLRSKEEARVAQSRTASATR